MKKILIIGATGTLGSSIYKMFKQKGYSVAGMSRNDKEYAVNLNDEKKLISTLNHINPTVIINCTGIVDIDYCEENPIDAWKLHVKSTIYLFKYLSSSNVKYVHISTDQFYDGKKRKNSEDSGILFLNEYSSTKYLADVVASKYKNSIIVRTNIVGFKGKKKKNFIESMIYNIEKKKKLTLFDDYIVSSIDTTNLSKIIIDLLKKNFKGIINIGSRESFSKKKFILKLAKKIGFTINNYNISSAKQLRVKRQLNCALNVSKIESFLGKKMPTLDQVLDNLIREYKKK